MTDENKEQQDQLADAKSETFSKEPQDKLEPQEAVEQLAEQADDPQADVAESKSEESEQGQETASEVEESAENSKRETEQAVQEELKQKLEQEVEEESKEEVAEEVQEEGAKKILNALDKQAQEDAPLEKHQSESGTFAAGTAAEESLTEGGSAEELEPGDLPLPPVSEPIELGAPQMPSKEESFDQQNMNEASGPQEMISAAMKKLDQILEEIKEEADDALDEK